MPGDYTAGSRRSWRLAALALLSGAIAAAVLLPADGPVSAWFRGIRLGGDVRRELEFLQQFGDLASAIVIGLAIYLVDPSRRRRLLDWAAGIALNSLVLHALKVCFGRARPRFGDPWAFNGAWNAYPLPRGDAVVHARSWEVWKGISSDLWSMPSSHTAAAALMAVALARMYPRLAPLVYSLVAIVAAGRVILGAHYLSDVAAGTGVGLAAGIIAMDHRIGQRIAKKVRGAG